MSTSAHVLILEAQQQSLYVYAHDQLLAQFPVSTAKNGLGEQINSEKTPRGWHVIRAKIGADYPPEQIFVGRRPQALYSAELASCNPQRDFILARILWLSGLEPGKNRLGSVDSMRRYIYIHGTNEPVGEPNSHGCVRMTCQDVVTLFNIVPVGAKLFIKS